MLFLDTHVLVWLYQKELERFTPRALDALEQESLYISPSVLLELEYLYEIKRITEESDTIISYLSERIGLVTDAVSFLPVAERARSMKWTRDPFDRIITAQADFHNAALLSKDRTILKHYSRAFWKE